MVERWVELGGRRAALHYDGPRACPLGPCMTGLATIGPEGWRDALATRLTRASLPAVCLVALHLSILRSDAWQMN